MTMKLTKHRDGSVSVRIEADEIDDLRFPLAAAESGWAKSPYLQRKYPNPADHPLNALYWLLAGKEAPDVHSPV